MPEIARPAGTRLQTGSASERTLPIGGHDRLAGRAASRRIAPAPIVLVKDPPTPLLILPRAIGTRLGQHLDPIALDVDREQAETNEPTEPMHPAVPVATAPRRRHGEPHLISRSGSIHRLQQEIEAESELHFDDRQPRRHRVANGDDVAAANLALDGKPGLFEEMLDGRIKSGLGHGFVRLERAMEKRNRFGERISQPVPQDARRCDEDDPHDLQRFVDAQNPVIDRVLAELRRGRKTGHWMWFVFPQLKGLGSSAMANRFAIKSREEAAAYLDHPILGSRLRECTRLVTAVPDLSVSQIFGFPDDRKFLSSMSLFAHAGSENGVFIDALQKYFDGRFDPATIERLRPSTPDLAGGPGGKVMQ
jgi:uncharacterized protein (DUF1810 family)